MKHFIAISLGFRLNFYHGYNEIESSSLQHIVERECCIVLIISTNHCRLDINFLSKTK